MNHYSTDITDNQWQVIEKFLDVQVRKRKYPLRSIVDAIIADGGYRGKRLSDTLKATLGCELEVVLRPDECPLEIPSDAQTMDCRNPSLGWKTLESWLSTMSFVQKLQWP